MSSGTSANVPEGSLWERHDEVFKVELVYDAHKRKADGSLEPITLVKVICVDPMPRHVDIGHFGPAGDYKPYDPEAE